MYPTANATWPCVDGGGPESEYGNANCQTDNAELSVYAEMSSITLTGWGVVQVALSDFNNNSDLNVSYPASASYSGDNETDIIYTSGTVPAGNLGTTWCDDNDAINPFGGTDKCDQHYVRFGTSSPDAVLACHESGHAVGLTHGNQANPVFANDDDRLGCMRTPRAMFSRVLGYNNVDNINETY